MALNSCSSGLVMAALALILLPAQHYLPGLFYNFDDPSIKAVQSLSPPEVSKSFNFNSEYVLPLDGVITMILLVLGVFIYICELIQRKLKERRIEELKHFLSQSLDRLNAWDVRQRQLESRLQMIQNATTEYNLLLYLIRRKNRCIDSIPSTYFFDREFNDEFD